MARDADAMDVLQTWLDEYNARARPAIPLRCKGEAGGAQLRLTYSPAADIVAVLHMVAVTRPAAPAIVVKSFEGPAAEATAAAGLWASGQLGRRPGV